MGMETSIQWCDSTLSNGENRFWIRGAHAPAGLDMFSAIRQFERQLDEALTWPNLYLRARENKPWLNKSKRLIMVDGIGDPFSADLPPNWLGPYLDRMAAAPHIWLFLTKESTRMRKFFQEQEVPPNFWLGVSVTGPHDVALADELWRIPDAVVPWICAEPLRGPIDVSKYAIPECIDNGTFGDEEDERGVYTHECDLCNHYNGLGWVVTGIETDHLAAQDELDWIWSVRDQCFSAGLPLFLTTIGGPPVSYAIERLLETGKNPCRRIPTVLENGETVCGFNH